MSNIHVKGYLMFAKKVIFFVIIILTGSALFAQQNTPEPQKFALIIGNGSYRYFGSLQNAVNDANDMTAELQNLGFTVDKLVNANQAQMFEAITRFRDNLSRSRNAYGFFYYAGHAVQHQGVNFLIPADANIPNANYLGSMSVPVQSVMAEINDAGNELNIIVLDACRDFPAAWSRSTARGLSVVSNQPAGSIIVYATSAGSVASDGTGRNGLFTAHLLAQLRTPGLSVREVFDFTGDAVATASNRQQTPAVYSQYFRTAYLGSRPAPVVPAPVQPALVTPGPVPEVTPEVTPVLAEIPEPPAITPVSPPLPAAPVRPQQPDGNANSPNFNTLGVSVGSSFADPMVMTTVHGTYSPIRNVFFELGMDIGFLSVYEDVESYYSLYPYVNAAYFFPFRDSGGFFIGAGGGYMIGSYTFAYGEAEVNVFAVNVTAGINILNAINISYTLKTNFNSASSKLAVSYVYRF